MVWLHRCAGLVLTGPPGTGSTAVGHLLDGVDGFGQVGGKHDTARQALGPDHGATVWTVTRDPWDWWAAEWWRGRTRWSSELDDPTSWVQAPHVRASVRDAVRLGFDPWLRRRLVDPRPRALHTEHEAEADVVLRMEDLGAGVERLLAVCGHQPRPVEVHNATADRPPDEELHTAWTVRRITQVHGAHAAKHRYRAPLLRATG